jgi:autotransporter-associated beta strand protein
MRPQDSHSSHQTDNSRRAAPRRASLRAVLLATSALASAALPITVAHAVDGIWSPTQGSNDFDLGKNWSGAAVPDVIGTATFNASKVQDIKFTTQTQLSGMTLNQDAGDYTFDTQGNIVTFNGFGLTVGSNASLVLSAGPGGRINFTNKADGGTARIKLDGGTLDISGLTMEQTGVGSIEGSGIVALGSKKLFVGRNDLSTTFSGVIQAGGAGGSLAKEGTGALTLSATSINTYTGGTFVNNGALIVDGSIEKSSVFVGTGATLAGTGTVGDTFVDVVGTLAPGHGPGDGTFGTLKVQGNLTFTAAATYLIQVSPAAASNTHVTGQALLGGATVVANFAPGSYITQHYNILDAGVPLSDKFGSLATNLSPLFKATLSYDANDVFLDLSPNSFAIAGLNANQRNVSNAIFNSLNLTGILPPAFATAMQAPAGLTQISGETAVGTQQATFDAMNQFMGVMLDPTVGALSGGRAFAQANNAYASMPRKAPLAAEAFDARWGVWAAGFGGSQSISGDAVLGSNKTTSTVFGSAAGAEYRFSPNTVAGFALAGGGTNFRVANGGSGNSDLFQAGAYVKHTQGAAFLAAALAYGWQDVTTNRTVTVAGIDNLRGRFNSNAISGRLEGGYKVATQAGEFTPYAAGQFTSYRLPSYAEQVASGANTFALSYNGKDVTATRSELGLRTERAVALTDATLMLRSRLAWAHDFNTDRNVQAAFMTLPGSAFVVNGAQPAADTALTTISAEMLWRNGWSAAVTADAQLSDTTHSYSGKGVVRYNW